MSDCYAGVAKHSFMIGLMINWMVLADRTVAVTSLDSPRELSKVPICRPFKGFEVVQATRTGINRQWCTLSQRTCKQDPSEPCVKVHQESKTVSTGIGNTNDIAAHHAMDESIIYKMFTIQCP